MSKLKLVLFVPLALLLLEACVTGRSSSELIKLRLDMTKGQVFAALGEPSAARGSIRNKYDQVIEVWEYQLRKPEEDNDMYMHNTKYPYWLYFCNGKLVQWGAAGDWRREADKIYEMRFR